MKSSVDYYQNEFRKFNEFAENFELHKVGYFLKFEPLSIEIFLYNSLFM